MSVIFLILIEFGMVSYILQQDRQGTCNTEARSCNHCYCGKAVSITYSECVFVA